YVWIAFVVWFSVARYMGWLRAALLVLPTSVYVFTAIPAPNLVVGVYDFLALGTELLPLSLLLASCLILITGAHVPTQRRIFIACFVAGLAIWAKPQTVFLAISVVAAAILLRHFLDQRSWDRPAARALVSDALIACAGFLLPTVLFIIWMAAGQTLDDFISEPGHFNWVYITARDTIPGDVSPPLISRFESLGNFILGYPLAFLWALAGLVGLSTIKTKRDLASTSIAAAIWLLPLIAAGTTLFFTMPLVPHYANILYGGAAIAAVLGSRLAVGIDPQRLARSTAWLPFALIATLAALATLAATGGAIERNLDTIQDDPAVAAGITIDHLAQACPTKSDALVWGTATELYAAYDWTPASRYLGPGWILSRTSHQGIYRDRLIGELKAKPPQCIVEALDPKFPTPGWTLADNVKTLVPQLTPWLDRCYNSSDIAIPDGRPVHLYVWNGRCQ
ncbi:MAG: hypothetical protein WCK06_10540, partial [Actinomycetota bacterium]